jgi:hypothetical protein
VLPVYVVVGIYIVADYIADALIALGGMAYESVVNMAGNATTQSPYGSLDENDALNTQPGPFAGCNSIKWAIKVLKAQIAWRYTDLVPGTPEYNGHFDRIEILEKHLESLISYCNMFCEGNC